MCTALSFTARNHYFGRNLDLDRSLGEEVCILPRRCPYDCRDAGVLREHYALIGMATVADGVPLFYDAVNEHGLAMAGLNFPGNAHYAPPVAGKENVPPFAFIPYLLGRCKSVAEARTLLSRIELADIAFSDRLPPAPLHWMISDREADIVVETMRDGMHIHENPMGVLTNNPPFAHHREKLASYAHLRTDNAAVTREEYLPNEERPYSAYCQGLGAVGLPGDVSSMSRFVRAAFGRKFAVCDGEEASAVGQFFHLLASVEMVKGVCRTDEGTWDYTVYSACMNTDRGLYYYTTYGNRRIACVDLHGADLDGDAVRQYPLLLNEDIAFQN